SPHPAPPLLRPFPTRRSSDLPLEKQTATLTPVFGPHLASLAGMSRPHDDWVIDNLLNPASIGPYLPIFEAIAAIEHDFEFFASRSEEHTSELQSRGHLVCRLL